MEKEIIELLEKMDKRFSKLEERLDSMENKITSIDTRLSNFEKSQKEISDKLNIIENRNNQNLVVLSQSENNSIRFIKHKINELEYEIFLLKNNK